ncbi:MAG: PEGA domain-containing protein [Candidatus Korobacteraceae bacterium]
MRQLSSVRPDLSASSGSAVDRFFRNAFLLTVLIIMATALPAAAQSEWQLYGGTSFLWAKTSPYVQQYDLGTLHEFGWQTDISQYPWRWFGGTLESSGFYGRPNIYDPSNHQTYSDLINVKTYTIMFGPTFAYMANPRFQPFGHVLLGGAYREAGLTSKANDVVLGQTLNPSQWIFGWALGGGADVSINRLVAIRGQVDWLPTTFKNGYNDRENNLRVTVGLVFRFGNGEPSEAGFKSTPPLPSADSSSADMSSNSTTASQPVVTSHSSPAATLDNTPHVLPPAMTTAPGDVPARKVAKAEPPATSAPGFPVVAPTQTLAAAAPAALPAAPRGPDATANLQPGGAAAAEPIPAQPASAMPASPPPAMVEFWSQPTGADVEVDGAYVGSTFSMIAIPPGEHTITIRKHDFATWQRTIRVTAGNVRVAAYLEQVRYTVHFDH